LSCGEGGVFCSALPRHYFTCPVGSVTYGTINSSARVQSGHLADRRISSGTPGCHLTSCRRRLPVFWNSGAIDFTRFESSIHQGEHGGREGWCGRGRGAASGAVAGTVLRRRPHAERHHVGLLVHVPAALPAANRARAKVITASVAKRVAYCTDDHLEPLVFLKLITLVSLHLTLTGFEFIFSGMQPL
jgi:hypothetical protein